MTFLTGPRLEIINEYIILKRYKNKLVIPIGKQILKLKNIKFEVSKNGNEMLVLSLWKAPEEIGESKRSFHMIKRYYTKTMLERLKSFVLEAFNYTMVSDNIQSILVELEALKGQEFKCIIRHQKRLIMEDGKPVEKRSLSLKDAGLLTVIYEPKLWRIGTHDLKPEEHKLLIINFNREEKEIFNTALKERFSKYYK